MVGAALMVVAVVAVVAVVVAVVVVAFAKSTRCLLPTLTHTHAHPQTCTSTHPNTPPHTPTHLPEAHRRMRVGGHFDAEVMLTKQSNLREIVMHMGYLHARPSYEGEGAR